MACLNPIFASHMVFAAKKPLRVYGTGEGEVSVSFVGQTRTVTAKGAWEVEFPPMEYGGPYVLTASFDGTETVLEDIYIGEVLLMSGQSNMQFKLCASNYPKEEICGNPMMRLFTAPRLEEGEPYTPADGWVVCTAENAPQWSALAYMVGKLRAEKGVAVGLISCYQGASIIESWFPEGTLERLGISIAPEGRNADHTIAKFHVWNQEGILFRQSLSHLFPFSLSAAVWYQGESNWHDVESRSYKAELAEMIRVWREAFRDDALPFVVVQIADFGPRLGEGWSNIQKAQADISRELSAVRTAISADVSETDNIHPPTKHLLAARIADALNELL